MINYDSFLSRAGGRMKESAIRRMGTVLAQGADIVSFAPGYPAAETFAWTDFQDIARDLLSGSDGGVLQYGATRGYRPLLETIAGLMAARGVETDIDRLLITTGSQQGLDLVARVLLDPDDVVLVELPTYTGAITAFRNVQAEMVGVPQEADGIDLAALDDVFTRLTRAGRRVRLLYVVPNFQNPTGLLVGLHKRKLLLEWVARRNLLLLEDDPYRDLYFPDSATEADVRAIRADDTEGRVIYLSSFSKTMAPGYRVAWIDAPAPLAAKLECAKQAADLCTGTFDQRVIFEACRRGILERQLPILRMHYQQKRDVMVESLRTHLGADVSWPAPRGGFFIWATLQRGIDADAMIPRAVAHGVIYVAGQAFFVNALRQAQGAPNDRSGGGSGQNIIRLSFSAPSLDRIREGVRRLASVVRNELTERRGEAAGPSGVPPLSPAVR
jgi:2-aminoadipate transaminase